MKRQAAKLTMLSMLCSFSLAAGNLTFFHHTTSTVFAASSSKHAVGKTPSRASSPPTTKGATLIPLPVHKTTLSPSVIQSDVGQLSSLLAAHPGDGTTRGPDQLVYNIDVTVDPNSHEFAGHVSLHLHNNLGVPITVLYFNVWPNALAFTKLGGAQTVSNVTWNGKVETYELHGTVLSVHLQQPIEPNADGLVGLDFLTKMPKTADRYGWEGTTMNFGNAFPVLAVHDQYGWVTPPYYTDGESFYTLTADFHLHVTTPKSLNMAISGEVDSKSANPDNTITYNVHASGVRDVAMIGNSSYKVMQGTVGATTISVYYTPTEASFAPLMLSVAKKSLLYYTQHYGPYPYPTLKVAGMQGWFGGMEYPQFVMISFNSSGNYADEITADVAHEVAHQWFYSMIGDDQYLTPWMDEAFANFSELRVDNGLNTLPMTGITPEHVTYPVSAFTSSDFESLASTDRYYEVVYQQGAAVLKDLMNLLGEEKFDKMMQDYVQKYAYQVATTKDFIDATSAAAGKDMTPFFQARKVLPDDDLKAPIDPWATKSEQLNGRSWH